ncbi:transcriptional regulator [Fictibacillus macauensis ZFHKF-1]|uniref:Transcriptional regulator n=1 Tax=Fictibacillus macauensis ZFHKF-1 TaxID=1196324 RepID=I8AN16_9BACL|nr:TetR/AcrR family transcriptional regulator [Fictibacillus macauensis]EIT87402.1 transcriptional regulator [Fictibacillus macauensis ZFHKF-1]
MPKVTEKYKEEKRMEIVRSAMQCFGQKGYEATTIDDIVRTSKVSKGAIYNYFSSKEEIYLQILHHQSVQFFKEVEEAFASRHSAKEKLAYLFERFEKESLTEERRTLMRLYTEFWLYSARQDALKKLMQERYDQFTSFVTSIIDEGKRSGEFKEACQSERVAQLFWALRDGNVLHFSLIGEEKGYKQMTRFMEQWFTTYIYK